MCRQPDKENTILTCSFGVAVVSEGWTECVSLGGYVFRAVMGDTSVGDPHSHIWAGGRQITHAVLVASSLNNNAIFEIPQGINKTFSSHTSCGGYSPLHTIMQCMLLQPPSVCTHIWVIAFSFCCYIPAGRLLVIQSSIFLFGRWRRGAELQEALKYMCYLCLRLVRECLKYLNCAKVTSIFKNAHVLIAIHTMLWIPPCTAGDLIPWSVSQCLNPLDLLPLQSSVL